MCTCATFHQQYNLICIRVEFIHIGLYTFQYKISVGAVMSLGTGNAPPQDLLDNHPVLKQVISKFGFIQNFKDFFQLILNEVGSGY